MTRYIEWGDREPKGDHCLHLMGGRRPVDPTDLSTVKALWAALPPDLRLALAKTCPKVAGKWAQAGLGVIRRCQAWTVAEARPAGGEFFGKWCASVDGTWLGDFPTLAEAQSACDAALADWEST